ncbi:hypothetical protein [Hyphobacterium sp.]|uniref:hypothetical protein n=1 Tax=Hyphobacterium sp. TaxID=2004662 RepID=UPI003BAB9799
MLNALTISFVAILLSGQETDANFDEMPSQAYAAWNCAFLAGQLGDEHTEDARELSELGYRLAITFLEAAFEDPESVDTSRMPVVYLLSRHGPSPDFVAGAWWAHTANNAVDEYSRDDQLNPLPSDTWEMRAESLYREKNCEIILQLMD